MQSSTAVTKLAAAPARIARGSTIIYSIFLSLAGCCTLPSGREGLPSGCPSGCPSAFTEGWETTRWTAGYRLQVVVTGAHINSGFFLLFSVQKRLKIPPTLRAVCSKLLWVIITRRLDASAEQQTVRTQMSKWIPEVRVIGASSKG